MSRKAPALESDLVLAMLGCTIDLTVALTRPLFRHRGVHRQKKSRFRFSSCKLHYVLNDYFSQSSVKLPNANSSLLHAATLHSRTEFVLAHRLTGLVLEQQIRLASANSVSVVLCPHESLRQPGLNRICDGRQTSFAVLRDPLCKTRNNYAEPQRASSNSPDSSS